MAIIAMNRAGVKCPGCTLTLDLTSLGRPGDWRANCLGSREVGKMAFGGRSGKPGLVFLEEVVGRVDLNHQPRPIRVMRLGFTTTCSRSRCPEWSLIPPTEVFLEAGLDGLGHDVLLPQFLNPPLTMSNSSEPRVTCFCPRGAALGLTCGKKKRYLRFPLSSLARRSAPRVARRLRQPGGVVICDQSTTILCPNARSNRTSLISMETISISVIGLRSGPRV